ncbi:MAG: hypothetical protein AAFQ94_18085 [Bacteroidota bacterium]
MKRLLTLLIIFSGIIESISAQDVKAGKDESTILLDNSNIGFDPGETSITFKYNNLGLSKTKKKNWLWAINAEGKNNEGLASIFSSSQIVPSSEFSLFAGYSWSNSDKIDRVYLTADDDILNQVLAMQDKLVESVYGSVRNVMAQERGRNFESCKALNEKFPAVDLNTISKDDTEKLPFAKLKNGLEKIIKNSENTREVVRIARDMLNRAFVNNADWKKFVELNQASLSAIDDADDEVADLDLKYWRTSIFIHYGNSSTKYNTFLGWDSTNLDNSFKANTFRGINFGLGINHDIASKWLLGFEYTYEETNNLNTLTSAEYTVRTNNVAANMTGSTELKKTAYPDRFKEVFVHNYDFDVIQRIPVGEKYLLLLDYYARINRSTNEERLVSTTDIGISSSFFNGEKGNFIGGIYFEVPDFNENVERKKPIEDRELNPLYRRVTFGIYTKFSFAGLTRNLY